MESTSTKELGRWLENELEVILLDPDCDFGLTLGDVQQMASYITNQLNTIEEIANYLEGFLADNAYEFAGKLMERREEVTIRKGHSLQGIWKTQALNPIQIIMQRGGFSAPEAENIFFHTKEILDEEERRIYLLGLLGTGFEGERVLMLIKKTLEKERLDEEKALQEASQLATSTQASKEKEKKVSKKQKATLASLLKEKVGHLPEKFKGRPRCECMATVHPLITNCLSCGKIICEFEGEGICPFCGRDPTPTNGEQPGLSEATTRMLTLMDYQENSAQRTKVNDQAADFDQAGVDQYNKWLSAEERAIAMRRVQEREREEEERKGRRVMTLDFEGKRVVVEKVAPPARVNEEPVKKEKGDRGDGTRLFRNPTLNVRVAPKFISQQKEGGKEKKPTVVMEEWDIKRLQSQ